MWGGISLWLWFGCLCWLVMLNIYSTVTCWSSTCLLWQSVYSGLLLVFKSCNFSYIYIYTHIYGCVNSLFCLDISSSLDIWLANVFSIPYLSLVLQGNCAIKWMMRFCPPALVFRSLKVLIDKHILWCLYSYSDNLKVLIRKPCGLNPKENSLRFQHYSQRGPQTY